MHIHGWTLERTCVEGLGALQAQIENTCRMEYASNAVQTELGQDKLRVRMTECLVVRHLRETSRTVSE